MDHEVIAPARRVYLPIDYNAWGDLTAAGMKLVDISLAWAVATEPSRGKSDF